ncbi:uncharacterized protein BJX67DRAFT_314112 [Aspergillus lucknowensis]|uniref:Uncharacterized protein n=1 Tax=Aspergillus lucknowensis TaxID=176173 RepID=A0ABR4L9C5_9EURO
MAPSQAPSADSSSTQQHASTNTPAPDYTNPSFDPVDFLNDVLPPLALPSQSQPQSPRAVNLADLSTRVQSILSQANAQNIRHSATLTTLTDEILRSGNRLAYEVEVLRGETITLSELLTEGLAEEISRFTDTASTVGEEGQDKDKDQDTSGDGEEKLTAVEEPEYITNLRTLNQVRARLEDVVKTFGDAMEWPLPPSETSLASSFISVSAPEPGPDSHSREEKGQEVARKLRAEISELLDSDPGLAGVEAATRRVEAIRTLATVWKGTAEEKARSRFVEGLVKMVEERRRAIEAAAAPSRQTFTSGHSRGHQRQESEGPGGGIFRNLQRLRDEIYLE